MGKSPLDGSGAWPGAKEGLNNVKTRSRFYVVQAFPGSPAAGLQGRVDFDPIPEEAPTTLPAFMKFVQADRVGAADTLQFRDVAVSQPEPGQLLTRVEPACADFPDVRKPPLVFKLVQTIVAETRRWRESNHSDSRCSKSMVAMQWLEMVCLTERAA